MNEQAKSLWQRAGALADATPDSRNRYVDFLRAASIAAVIFGHWLVSAPYMADGSLVPGHMLALAPWTRWLTLVVQVNGKKRGEIQVPPDISNEIAQERALAVENVQKILDGREPKKVIVVPGRLVNIVG